MSKIGWRADDDIMTVQLLLERGGSPNAACFHAQQAAEKYLKGFLAHHDYHVRKIHDLELLLENCKKIDTSFADITVASRSLNRFYLETRYPGDFLEGFSKRDAEEAFKAASHIKEFVSGKIKN